MTRLTIANRVERVINYLKNNQVSCREFEDLLENQGGDIVVCFVMDKAARDEELTKVLKESRLVNYQNWLKTQDEVNSILKANVLMQQNWG